MALAFLNALARCAPSPDITHAVCGVFWKCQMEWLIVFIRPDVSSLIFCLLVLSFNKRGLIGIFNNNCRFVYFNLLDVFS